MLVSLSALPRSSRGDMLPASPAPWLWLLAFWASLSDAAACPHRRCPCPYSDEDPALDVPPELGSPTAEGMPHLQSAGARSLSFLAKFTCVESDCPSSVFFHYKKENSTECCDVPHSDKQGVMWITKIENLEPDTQYIVWACPKTPNHSAWHRPVNEQCFSETKVVTCSEQPPPVTDLRVHSAGAQWLALSWRPPASRCLTELQYDVGFSASRRGQVLHGIVWQYGGRFHSANPLLPEGHVTPCVAWPGRHCMLLAGTRSVDALFPGATYDIRVWVRREDEHYSVVQETQGKTRDDIESGPPEDLHCTATTPPNLTVRWRAPLQPGGRLSNATVLVRSLDETNSSLTLTQDVFLRAEYSQEVTGLQPNTRYNVTVWFTTMTRSGRAVKGANVSVEVWTQPCALSRDLEGAGDSKMAARIDAAEREAGVGDVWVWLAAVLLMLALLPLAFFVGCRSGRQRDSKKDGKEKCSGGGEFNRSGTPTKMASDEANLCTAVLPPCSTPPAVMLSPPEYAEVRLGEQCVAYSSSAPYAEVVGSGAAHRASYCSTGAAYAEVTGSGAPSRRSSYSSTGPYAEITGETTASRRISCQSSHHYEDLAVATGDARKHAESVSCYAEVLAVSSSAQPVMPTILPPKAPYIYAQVDKRKKKKKKNIPPPPSSPPPLLSVSSSRDFTIN